MNGDNLFCQVCVYDDALSDHIHAVSPRFTTLDDAEREAAHHPNSWIGIYRDHNGLAEHVADIQLDGRLGAPDHKGNSHA